jgi:hypothetical protein
MTQVSGCNKVPFIYNTSVGVYEMNSVLRGMPVVVGIGVVSKKFLVMYSSLWDNLVIFSMRQHYEYPEEDQYIGEVVLVCFENILLL